jgi:hypothetical protein
MRNIEMAIHKPPTFREKAERGDDISSVLLEYTPNQAVRGARGFYSFVGYIDEIEKDRLWEFSGHSSFEDYVERVLNRDIAWVEAVRGFIRTERKTPSFRAGM